MTPAWMTETAEAVAAAMMGEWRVYKLLPMINGSLKVRNVNYRNHLVTKKAILYGAFR